MQEVQETRVQFLGWEDPLEKEMATHSSILARKITWTEHPDRLQSRRHLATKQQQQQQQQQWLCHSFKGCALTPSLLFQQYL